MSAAAARSAEAPRVAIGGLVHESNTYADRPTTMEAFDIVRGRSVVEHFSGTSTGIGGMLAAAADEQVEIVPLLHALAEPSGVIERDTYDGLAEEFLRSVAEAKPLHIVSVELHGAGAAQGIDDIEADLCRRLRSTVGPRTVIVGLFDLHGNITQEMADKLDLVMACREYPHTDYFERGRQAVLHAVRLVRCAIRTTTYVESLPLIVGSTPQTSTLTPDSPAARLKASSEAQTGRPGIVDCSFFQGFHQADVPFVGASVVVTSEAGIGDGEAVAEELAAEAWQLRAAFEERLPTPVEAVQEALAVTERPVVLNDIGDNPGGGAPGDCTRLLSAMLDAEANGCFGVLFDPESVSSAAAAGPGATVQLALGGKRSKLSGPPLECEAYVVNVTDGQYELQAMGQGVALSMGRMVRLRVGTMDILVGSKRRQIFDPGVFDVSGISLSKCDVVGVKSAIHFRAGFAAVAGRIISSNSPGLSSARVADFEHSRLLRPVFPLSRDCVYPGDA